MMNSSKSTLLLIILSVLFILSVMSVPVTAEDEQSTPKLYPMPELDAQAIERDAMSYRSGTVTDISKYVEAVSDELNLNLSPDEIRNNAVTLASYYLTPTGKISPNSSIEVINYSNFQQDFIDVLGLNLIERNSYLELTRPSESFCDTVEVLESIRSDMSRDGRAVDPSDQSAPYAYGKLAYVCIFVDFQGNSSDTWSNSDIDTAFEKAQLGTAVIPNRAPASADIEQVFYYSSVTVPGNWDYKNETTWGENGWMNAASATVGFAATDTETSTEVMIEHVKYISDADSVVVLYCIRGVGRSYALPVSYGYADRCVIFYLKSDGFLFFDEKSDKNVYGHETLHLYGALDEYPNASGPGMTSNMAVSPMREWYTNTNHHNSSNHQHSIMCAEGLYGIDNPVISQSTKNFIGWGDRDGDSIIDALEIRAGTT